MLWDLTAMSAGTTFPSLTVLDTSGSAVQLDGLLPSSVCILVTATEGAYGEQELAALGKLRTDYGAYATFISIALDRTPGQLETWLKARPDRDWKWFTPADRQPLLDALRLRSIPTPYLLKERELTASPGPLPSQGLAAALFRIKTKADEEQRLKFGRGAPPKH